MTIDPFVCGVLATLFVEMIGIFVWAIISNYKSNKKNK